MNTGICACGAAIRLVPVEFDSGPRRSRGPLLEWLGGRIGFDRLALEDARYGASTCPACQHRASVARHAGTSDVDGHLGR
jgi:hypothetical protein